MPRHPARRAHPGPAVPVLPQRADRHRRAQRAERLHLRPRPARRAGGLTPHSASNPIQSPRPLPGGLSCPPTLARMARRATRGRLHPRGPLHPGGPRGPDASSPWSSAPCSCCPGSAVLTGGGILLWAHSLNRSDGFVVSPHDDFSSEGYALVSDRIDLSFGPAWLPVPETVGTARLEVTGTGAGRRVRGGRPGRRRTGVPRRRPADRRRRPGLRRTRDRQRPAARRRAVRTAHRPGLLDRGGQRSRHPGGHLGSGGRRLDVRGHERRRLAAGGRRGPDRCRASRRSAGSGGAR